MREDGDGRRRMKTVSVKMPDKLYEQLRSLVDGGLYQSISEALRTAVRDLLLRELWSNGWADGSEVERAGGENN